MSISLGEYIKKRFPDNMYVEQVNSEHIIISDKNAEKSHGYNIKVVEEARYIEACIEFEDYAKELSDYATKKILERNDQIVALFSNDKNLYATKHTKSIENLFDSESLRSDGWFLKIGYKKNVQYSTENFVDLLLSFILFIFPYDIEAEEEGIPYNSLHSNYERSYVNRSFCLAFHGYNCKACGLNMRDKYGDIAREFIHVHHTNPVADAGIQIPDPINDMIPLCPNCHSIAHMKNPPFSLQEIMNMIKSNDEKL